MPILKDLHLRMTSKCNFNCVHCYAADWFKENHSLDIETCRDLIKQAKDLGCLRVTFTGGEPLVSKATLPAVKYCIDNNLRVEIESNGVLMGKFIEKAKDYIHKIEFAISHEGDEMRDEKYTPVVISNIKKLVELKCNLKIQTVITEVNVNKADELFEFTQKLGVKNRVFLSHSTNGNAKDLPLLDLKRWLSLLKYLREKYDNLIIELPDLFSGGKHKKCGWGVFRCEVMPNGDVTSCGPITFSKRDYIAGNIYKKRLVDIWSSKHFMEIRTLKQTDFKSLCSKCPYWTTCLGACRNISYAVEGNILSPHPFCVAFYDALKNNSLEKEHLDIVPWAYDWYRAINSEDTVTAPEDWEYYNRKMNAPILG